MTETEAPKGESLVAAVARAGRLVADWGRPAAIIGGIGIIARVRPRLTRDVDLVIAVEASELDALLALARHHGYDFDEEETRTFAEGGLARLWGPPSRAQGVGLDLLFVDTPFMQAVVTRANPVNLGGVTVPVATLEDLLVLKLDAHRPQDLDDIFAIKDVAGAALDMAYVREQARALGVLDRVELYFSGQD